MRRYLLLIASLGWLAQACTNGTLGERANSCAFPPCDVTECPAGESCSAATPAGLTFMGPWLADDVLFSNPTLKPVAVGGVESVTIKDPRLHTPLPNVPFGTEVASGIVKAKPGPGWTVQLWGVSFGSDMLRIVDPQTNELYDRVRVSTAPIESISLRTCRLHVPDGVTAGWPWRVVKGGSLCVFAALQGSGVRLVDETVAFELAQTDVATVKSTSWDRVSVAGDTTGSVTLSAVAGGVSSAQVPIEVVDGLDEIRLSKPAHKSEFPPPAKLVGSDMAEFCHNGFREGNLVLGVDWSYDAPDIVMVMPYLGGPPNCVLVAPQGTGHAVVVIRGGGIELPLEFEVSDS